MYSLALRQTHITSYWCIYYIWPQRIPLAWRASRHLITYQTIWRSTLWALAIMLHEDSFWYLLHYLMIWRKKLSKRPEWVIYVLFTPVPSLCSQFPVPSFQIPDPSSKLPVPCSLFPVPSFQFPVHSLNFSVPCSLFPAPWSLSPIPCSLIPDPWSLIPDPWSLIPDP